MQLSKLKSGKSVEGNEITSYISDKKSKKYIYLMGGVHGDEVEGVYVVDKLMKWLEDDVDVDLPLVVVPILNVDGYRSGSRVNSHGVDLNRNLDTQCWQGDFKEAKNNPGPSTSRKISSTTRWSTTGRTTQRKPPLTANYDRLWKAGSRFYPQTSVPPWC